jgi:hypothetical protein
MAPLRSLIIPMISLPYFASYTLSKFRIWFVKLPS